MVEGQKTKITARKIQFKKQSLQKHEITKKLMVTYTMDRNCSVEVIESIPLSEKERKYREPLQLYGNVGDVLKADAIRLYVAGIRDSLTGTVKEGVTGRHGATIINCNNHAIAKIQTPWQGHMRILGLTANSTELKTIK